MKQIVFSFLLIFFMVFSIFSQDNSPKNRIRRLQSGQERFSLLEFPAGLSQKQFFFDIPKESGGIKIALRDSSADLKLTVGLGYLDGVVAVEHTESTAAWDEVLFWSLFEGEQFQTGMALITVSLDTDATASLSEDGSFFISVEAIGLPKQQNIGINQKKSFILNQENLFFSSFQFSVSSTSVPLLFRWSAEEGTPTFFLRYGEPAWKEEDADYSFEMGVAEQEFVLGDDQGAPLTRGNWYISFVGKGLEVVKGKILLQYIKKSAVQLVPITALPNAQGNEMEGAMAAVVGITTPYRTACGAFVSSSGHILTSLSVVQDLMGNLVSDISIFVSTSIYKKPVYVFKATILSYSADLDLALLQVSSFAHNKPVPETFRFPYLSVASDLEIETGQPVSIIGFPFDSLRGEAGSVFSTTGIVSGFEEDGDRSWFKTSAISGSGGGVVINVYYELVGVNAVLKRVGSGETVTFYSLLEKLPSEWVSIFNR